MKRCIKLDMMLDFAVTDEDDLDVFTGGDNIYISFERQDDTNRYT